MIWPWTKFAELQRIAAFWKERAEQYEEIAAKLSPYAPRPECACGNKSLDPDPAGYYCDAYDYRGAPLACRLCSGGK